MDRPTRILAYVVGLAIVVAGIYVLFTQTPLADYIPAGVVLAIVLLVIGLGVMMLSTSFTGPRAIVTDRTVERTVPAVPTTRPYTEREVVYDSERPREPF